MKYLPSVDSEELPDRLIFSDQEILDFLNPVFLSAVNGVIQETDSSKAYHLYSLVLQLE